MKSILSVLSLVILCALVLPSVVSADIAPPSQPPGFNPEPGNEITQVRMMAETVTIDVLPVDPPQVLYSAVFTMRNLGSSTENLAVRFPIAAQDGWLNIIEIENIEIKVNDQRITYTRIEGPEPIFGFEDESAPWAEFDVSFSPQEDVMILVSYDLDGSGYASESSTYFTYLVSTGAGWKDTIGSGEIILRLPYDANRQNVILYDSENMPRFSGREVRWSFRSLEPERGDNYYFRIIRLAIWEQVISALDKISLNARDGEAYAQLGGAYKQALFASAKGYPRDDAGAADLYQWSKDAYEKAIALRPDNGPWHAGYAELVLNNHYWRFFQDKTYTADLHLGLQELDLARQLAPGDPIVLNLIEIYSSIFPDYIVKGCVGSFDFPALTQTPQFTPEDIATRIPCPTLATTLTPRLATATPQAEPTPKTASPICGGAVLILLPLALITLKSRIRIG